MPQSTQGESELGVGWVIAGIIGLGLAVSYCDTESTAIEPPVLREPPSSAQVEGAASQPSAPDAADEQSAQRAARHLRLALDAEGFAGAMIYSQNCFASLAPKFNWPKLDQCVAFDALATTGAESEGLFGPEASYFAESEVERRFVDAIGNRADMTSSTTHLALVQTAALARISELQVPPVGDLASEEEEVAEEQNNSAIAVGESADSAKQGESELDRIFGATENRGD